MRQNFFYNHKLVGQINVEEKTYYTYRNDYHVFHIFGEGFAISEAVLDSLIENGINEIIINYKNLRVYHCDIDIMLAKGEDYNDKGDKQIVLPRRYWRQNERPLILQSTL